jgi:hypothetical protein
MLDTSLSHFRVKRLTLPLSSSAHIFREDAFFAELIYQGIVVSLAGWVSGEYHQHSYF